MFPNLTAKRSKKRCLIISPRGTHPPIEGNAQRVLQLSTQIKQAGYDVHIALLPNAYFPRSNVSEMREHWGRRLHVLYEYKSWNYGYRLRHAICRMLRAAKIIGSSQSFDNLEGVDLFFLDWWCVQLFFLNLIHRYDIVIAEYIFSSRGLSCFSEEIRKIIDTHDIFHSRVISIKTSTGLESNWLNVTKASESAALRRADLIIAIQDEEARDFRELTDRPITVIGHHIPVIEALHPSASNFESILFVGSNNMLNVHGIRWFIEHVWQQVLAKNSTVRLRIVGTISGAIADDKGIDDRIELVGPVIDLTQEYRMTRIVINPILYGTGLAIKSIEALSHGKALICTAAGARGLKKMSGMDSEPLIVVDDPAEYAHIILNLLEDRENRIALEQKAIDFIKKWNQKQENNLANALSCSISM